MGRLGGFGSVAGSRRTIHWAVAIAVASALMTASALADTSTATKKTTKHSTHHTSSSSTAAASAKPGDTCKPTPDQAGIGIRALQTELMVAGLKCSAEKWNSFTAKFKTMLKTDADRLQHAFAKAYGKSGSSEMNAFVTSLANEASQRSNGFSEADYCKQQDVLFEKVLALTEKDLERFSVGRKLNVAAPVALCAPDPVEGAPAVTTAAAGAPGTAPATVQGATATVAVSTTPAPAGTPVSAKR
ncbi:MAG TPA: hypothetical protein VH722_10880 [Alphaproteobacteria bacterium]|jgi:hypothetical protein|nr:hypothetical protein [Alphaproteobacteria bacterium]